MAERIVWGFPVTIGSSGNKVWPPALKREAVRRIEEDGVKVTDIAAEIGARSNLVHKWLLADRRARGEKDQKSTMAFTELKIPNDRSLQKIATPAEITARLHVGRLCFEFPVSVSEEDLLKFVRAAGHAT